MEQHSYYTQRGYARREKSTVSPTMEDYLEMICRLAKEKKYVRVNQLAGLLNVTPPSASKMAVKLRESGMVDFEPYGMIQLTGEGQALGDYLLYRHDVLHRFFCLVNGSDDELEQVERIEHYLDRRTVENLERWMNAAADGVCLRE